jgi:hypothetical protein
LHKLNSTPRAGRLFQSFFNLLEMKAKKTLGMLVILGLSNLGYSQSQDASINACGVVEMKEPRIAEVGTYRLLILNHPAVLHDKKSLMFIESQRGMFENVVIRMDEIEIEIMSQVEVDRGRRWLTQE